MARVEPALRCHYPGQHELNSLIGDMYRAMIDASPSAVGPEFSVKISTHEARKKRFAGGWPGHKNLGRFWVPHTPVLRVGSWVKSRKFTLTTS